LMTPMPTDVLPDDRVLRLARQERALAQMEAHALDFLVLGREANARYITGAPRLWHSGVNPWGPACVLVRATGAIYMLNIVSGSEEGIPEDIPREHLCALSWDPTNLVPMLQSIEGSAEVRRVGTDSMSPLFSRLLPLAFPRAELVDAEPAM